MTRPWDEQNKRNWFNEQTRKRSYGDDVLKRLNALEKKFRIQKYGALSIDPKRYPLYLILGEPFDPLKKTILITGGVHGYETSGVHGAIAFMEFKSSEYVRKFNLICAPCISPWAYETVNRWNPNAVDPNRSFFLGSPAEESALFLAAISPYLQTLHAHFDLHETTDTDETVFRPALERRDGIVQAPSSIPDGFYTVGDAGKPQIEFQDAIIASVKKVTHIASGDGSGKIIGSDLVSEGVILYSLKNL